MKILKSVTAAQMRDIDRKATDELGIPSIVLMENAGRSVAEAAKAFGKGKIAVVCGSGNNGGDGFVAARFLSNWGFEVELVLVKPPETLKGDSLTNFKITRNLRLQALLYGSHTPLNKFNLIIDALLGTGTKGEIKDLYRSAIEEINNSARKVLSVDIPSGLDADTGELLGAAVKADTTVTMFLPKKGLLVSRALPFTGKLIVADIGIPLTFFKI